MIFKHVDFCYPIYFKYFFSLFGSLKIILIYLDNFFYYKSYNKLFFKKTINKKNTYFKMSINNFITSKKLISDNSYLKLFFKKYLYFFNLLKPFNFLDFKRRNIYLYYKLKLIYSWNVISFFDINKDFNFSSYLFSYFRIWSPFIHAFFYIKSTKKNHFFFFGLIKELLNIKYFYASALNYLRDKVTENFVFNLGKLNQLYNIRYKINYFESAGTFSLKKKLKRSNQIKDFLYHYILNTYNTFSVLNRFDFFFFHIKGLFRHVKFVVNIFKKAINLDKKIIRKTKRKTKNSYNSFIKLSKYQSLPIKKLVLKIKSFIKKTRFFIKKLNSNIEDESFLVGNIKTGLIYNRPIFKLNNYLKYPFFILSIKTDKLFSTIDSNLFNQIDNNLKFKIINKLKKHRYYYKKNKKNIHFFNTCFNTINDFFIRKKYVDYKLFIYQLIFGSTVDLKYVISFFKIKRIAATLYKHLYKKPRSIYLMDYTSYAFNGCRRVRHYKRH